MARSTHPPLVTHAALAEPWNRLTVAGLAASAASSNPKRRFIADCRERENWDGNLPRTLNFGDFQREANFFAGQLETLGLQPGDRALILLANTVEAAIAVTGCLIAGVTPALAGLDQNLDTLRIAAERISAAAIITTARVEDLKPADMARQIAARVITVRCVAAFGFGLPDGVIALEGWSEQDISPNPNRPARVQDNEALITFAPSAQGFAAHIRTEAQVIADALGVAARCKLGRDQVLLNTVQPAGSAWVAAAFLMPLFLGASVQLIGPFTANRLRAVLPTVAPDACLFCPADLVAKIDAARAQEPSLAALHGILTLLRPDDSLRDPGLSALSSLIDIHERALIALAGSAAPVETALGTHAHPMEGVLAEGQAYLMLAEGDDESIRAFGFAAAEIVLKKDDAEHAAA